MNGKTYATPVAFLLGPLLVQAVAAEVYMSESQAAGLLFPGLKLTERTFKLTPEDLQALAKSTGEKINNVSLKLYRAKSAETVYIDRTVGKHEFITYAVGISADGKIKGIEILEYRESYGHEVRKEAWRAQFRGKDAHSPLSLNDDIQNISGATLSSGHLTRGVKRVVLTHALISKRL